MTLMVKNKYKCVKISIKAYEMTLLTLQPINKYVKIMALIQVLFEDNWAWKS